LEKFAQHSPESPNFIKAEKELEPPFIKGDVCFEKLPTLWDKIPCWVKGKIPF